MRMGMRMGMRGDSTTRIERDGLEERSITNGSTQNWERRKKKHTHNHKN
jgi:hypothetical protein